MAPVEAGEGCGSPRSQRRRKHRPISPGTSQWKEEKKRSTKAPPPPPPKPAPPRQWKEEKSRITPPPPPPKPAPPRQWKDEKSRSTPPPPPPKPAPPRQWKEEKSRSTKPPPPKPAPPLPASSDDDCGDAQVRAMVTRHVRKIIAINAELKRQEAVRSASQEVTLTVESEFGDPDDGSTESVKARKVALRLSQSIVSLSSFAGGKRIRVCSGFVMRLNDSSDTYMVITSATLVRSLDGDNTMAPDLMVKVLLPNGDVTGARIFLVDFHYNIAVVEVASDMKLSDVSVSNDIVSRGDVLALGRAYEGGNIMCSRGKIVYQASKLSCSELLTSNCKITMAGVGGPLVNYNGHVVGINFYEKSQTPYLSIAIVSRILDHHQSFGKILQPWLGLSCSALETVALGVMERIYRKFPDVDKGLYISNVAEGSPADAAGLCVGDVIVKCGEKILSTTPQFGAILLDKCKEHATAYDWESTRDYLGNNISVEVVIKQQRDNCTMTKSIYADVMKECYYNRWPAPMPTYKTRQINVIPW